MKPIPLLLLGASVALAVDAPAEARINVVVVRNTDGRATAEHQFRMVPSPSRTDAATGAELTLVDGRRDPNGGDLDRLHDGGVPAGDDRPDDCFFFAAGTSGGRILVDLGSAIWIEQVNTYSWHRDTRGPQVYELYAGDEAADGFELRPQAERDPAEAGWRRVASVDTRPAAGGGGEPGGQYAVSVFDSDGPIGKYRYLLFDVSRTEDQDSFGNTFYSEIDVIPAEEPVVAEPLVTTVEAGGGKYQVTIDTTETPDLTEWVTRDLVPVVEEWYPKIVDLLPSDGYEAPRRFSITFSEEMRGVAATGGTRIRCAAAWFRRELDGEAKGAIVHEMVHVVQRYGRARRAEGRTSRPPGWLVEGIPDYIRWFLYEPESRGAEITSRSLGRARYDGSYRVSANFLHWVTGKHGEETVPKLNAVLRHGAYTEDLWKELTGSTVEELAAAWKADLEARLRSEAEPQAESEESE